MTNEPKTPKNQTAQTKTGKMPPRNGGELPSEALDKATGGLLPAVGPQK